MTSFQTFLGIFFQKVITLTVETSLKEFSVGKIDVYDKRNSKAI